MNSTVVSHNCDCTFHFTVWHDPKQQCTFYLMTTKQLKGKSSRRYLVILRSMMTMVKTDNIRSQSQELQQLYFNMTFPQLNPFAPETTLIICILSISYVTRDHLVLHNQSIECGLYINQYLYTCALNSQKLFIFGHWCLLTFYMVQ